MIKISPDLGTGRASVGTLLNFAWAAGDFTATDAMASTALTRSTAIDAIDTLVNASILQELPNARAAGTYRTGRPSRRFTLSDSLGVVVGIDAGNKHLAITVADPVQHTLVNHREEVDPRHTPAQRQKIILERLDEALSEAGADHSRVLAVCAGVAAPVNRDGVSPPHPDGFWERTNPGLAAALSELFPLVEVRNDAQLAAIAEGSEGAAVGYRDYVALLSSERMGGGVVIDGHVLHGAHGGVGEGIMFDSIIGVGRAFAIPHSLQEEARRAHERNDISLDGALGILVTEDRLDPRMILTLAASGDRDALLIAARTGESLARIIGVLGSTYDPARIVVCGAVAESVEPILSAARPLLAAQLHLPAPTLVASTLGAEVVSHGAIVTARRAARERAVPQLAERRLSATR